MLHEPAQSCGKDFAAGYKSKLGIKLFLVYAVIYAGFVAINVIKPVLMEKEIIFGLNLAVVYGFGLIIFALLLAVFYNHLCIKREKAANGSNAKGGQE
ncbi:MAG: DUF485 domain-containing protein [Anaerohalosphaeraceae bacterium]|nr:DUF485 domain-containing protein [Anaerohalosphaeraceae bacterium]